MSAKMEVVLSVFVALLSVSSALDMKGCGTTRPKVINGLLKLMGDIYSPGYLQDVYYPDDLICEYIIQAPIGFRVKLDFKALDIEPSELCTRDAVEIFEPIGRQPRVLGIFCGNQTYPPIVSSGNTISILFRSDFMIRRRGFHIRYLVTGMPMVCSLGQKPCRNRNCYSLIHQCDGKDDCGDGSDEENCGFPLPVTECGLRKLSQSYGYDRVIGGKEAVPGSWPWQADLQLSFVHPNGHLCGGTLINSQWVLSAAHCFEQFRQPEAWRIHLGNHHKFKKDETEQIRYGTRIILYPGTTGISLLRLPQIDVKNDIALLKLNAPVKFTDSVRPACLPIQGQELSVGQKCMASGWGMTRGTGSSHVLKEVELTIQTAKVCDGMMGPVNETTMICVKNEKGFQDVCHGDSGGPLVCEINNKWYVMGATSFGTQGNFEGGLCALPGSGTVYAKAAHKINWLSQQISIYS